MPGPEGLYILIKLTFINIFVVDRKSGLVALYI